MGIRISALACTLLLVALLVWPTVSTVADAAGQGNGSSVEVSGRVWLHTGVVACSAIAVALVLGAGLAWGTAQLRRPGLRGAALLAGAAPLIVPMYLHGMASWQVAVKLGLYRELTEEGPWSDLLVVGLVQGLRLSAFVHLLLFTGWQTIHARWLEAGLLVAPRGYVFRRIALPLLMPFAALACLLVGVLSFTDVSVPLLFQVRSVVALRLWDAHYRGLDPAGAWRAMVGPLLLTFLLVGLTLPLLWRRAATLLNARRDPAETVRARGMGALGMSTYIACLLAASSPLIHLLCQVNSMTLVLDTFRANVLLIGASLETALGAAAIALGFGIIISHSSDRSWFSFVFLVLALIFAAPAFLWAASGIAWWNSPGWRGAIYDSGVFRWLILGGRLAGIPALLIGLALMRLGARQREAAEISRVGPLRRFLFITYPQLRPALWISYALIVLGVIGDLDAAILMDLPGRTTLVVGLCNRLHISPRSPEVAMMALVILATVLFALLLPILASWLLRRLGRMP